MATLSDIKTRARQRADMVNSQFISDSELTNLINSSYLELYDLLVAANEDYYISSTTFTLASSDSGVWSLPSDFYKLKGVEYLLGGEYVTLYPFNWNTRNWRQRSVNRIYIGEFDLTYRMVGSNLRIEPDDNATGSYQFWYVPALTQLSSDSDTVDTIMTRAGWDEYIVIDVAMKMLAKEESNTSHLAYEKQQIIKRIEAMSGDRDIDQPERVSDTSRNRWNDWT